MTRTIPFRALAWFVLITFGLTWGVAALYIGASDWATTRFGALSTTHPLFYLATWAPAISALALVLAYAGPRGVVRFLSRLLVWRLPAAWAVFVLVVIPAVFVTGSLIKGGPLLAPLPEGGVPALLTLLGLMLFLGPVEELGWRGVAQPLLQRRMAPLWAAIVIGIVWGIWHLPAFLISTTVFSGWSVLPFLLGNVLLSILVTPMLNAGRGGLLWPALFHWQLINPVWPDAQPWDTWLLLPLVALVVWRNRDGMLRRNGAVTEVVPPGPRLALPDGLPETWRAKAPPKRRGRSAGSAAPWHG